MPLHRYLRGRTTSKKPLIGGLALIVFRGVFDDLLALGERLEQFLECFL